MTTADTVQAMIDRIVPEMEPVPEEQQNSACCEHMLYLDRARIRRELRAALQQPAAPDSYTEAVTAFFKASSRLLTATKQSRNDVAEVISIGRKFLDESCRLDRIAGDLRRELDLAIEIVRQYQIADRTQKPAAPDALDWLPEHQRRGAEKLLEACWDAVDADNIRQQLLQYVPPLSEWPIGAEYWAADGNCREYPGESSYYEKEPRPLDASSMFSNRDNFAKWWGCTVILPEHLRQHWQQSLFTRDQVNGKE